MGQARLGDRAESSYELLLAEIRNTGERFDQRFGLLEQGIDQLLAEICNTEQRIGQKIDQRADLSDKLFARRLLLLRFWLTGVIIGAGVIVALALAGIFS